MCSKLLRSITLTLILTMCSVTQAQEEMQLNEMCIVILVLANENAAAERWIEITHSTLNHEVLDQYASALGTAWEDHEITERELNDGVDQCLVVLQTIEEIET